MVKGGSNHILLYARQHSLAKEKREWNVSECCNRSPESPKCVMHYINRMKVTTYGCTAYMYRIALMADSNTSQFFDMVIWTNHVQAHKFLNEVNNLHLGDSMNTNQIEIFIYWLEKCRTLLRKLFDESHCIFL